MSEPALYPLVLEPLERELVWGGRALVQRYGKRADADATIGESWECYDANRIANGSYAGKTVAELRAQLGAGLTGKTDPACAFALLTKVIDARRALSVQVHPNDAYARRVEGQPNGKAECWVILEAERDASIVLGWKRDTSRAEFFERVKEGSLEELLRHVPVHAGDVFNLPAGMLHAIGAGIVLYETQQTSDLTYRIFDYNRPGPEGKPRELHVDKAADVLDFGKARAGALTPLRYALDGLPRETLVADTRFTVERVTLDDERRGIDLDGMPLVVFALGAPLELEARGESVRLQPYQSAIVPAGLDVVMARSLADDAGMLTAAPPHDREALNRRYSRASVDVAASSSFLAQF